MLVNLQNREAVYGDASGVHLSYKRKFSGDADVAFAVTQRLDGPGEFVVWMDLTACSFLHHADVHGTAFTVLDSNGTEEGPGDRFDNYLGWSNGSSPLALQVKRVVPPTELGFGARPLVQRVVRSENALHMEATAGGGGISVVTHRLSDQGFARTGTSVGTELPRPVATGAFALVAQSPYHIGFLPLAGGYRRLVSPSSGFDITWITLDRALGNALVWYETKDGLEGRGNYSIWTSPYSDTEAGIITRQVARLPVPAKVPNLVVNKGAAVVVLDHDKARLVRLSDGLVSTLHRRLSHLRWHAMETRFDSGVPSLCDQPCRTAGCPLLPDVRDPW